MGVLEVNRRVHASTEEAWKIVSDVDHYSDYAPNLSASHTVTGSGVGMRRSCSNLKGESWMEECTLWEEGSRYSFRVDTSDYPYPIELLQGTWSVEDEPGGTLITMRFEYRMKYGLAGTIAGFVLRPWFRRISLQLLDRWQVAIESGAAPAARRELHRA